MMHRPQNACYYNKCSSRGALQRTIETRIHRPVTCSRFSHSTIDSILIFQLRLRCCPQSSASFHRFNYSHSLYRGGGGRQNTPQKKFAKKHFLWGYHGRLPGYICSNPTSPSSRGRWGTITHQTAFDDM